MRRVLILTLAMVMILSTGLAFAEKVPSPRERGGPIAWANLSAEQRERLQALHRRFIEELAPLQGSLYARHLELKALWSDPKASPASLEAKEREAFDLLRQIQEKALRYRLEARSLLNPNQLVQFHGGFWLFRGADLGGDRRHWRERDRDRGWGHQGDYGDFDE